MKGRKFVWSDKAANAFQNLIQKLMEPPVLGYVNEHDTFVLDTDASLEAACATLFQIQYGQEILIAYGSKSFSKAKRNMCTTMQELCVVLMFLTEYHYYLWAKLFILRTDHASLVLLKNFKNADGLFFRWLQK